MSAKFVWANCNFCGRGRWVRIINEKLRNNFCRSCAGKITGMNSRGTGRGEYTKVEGYIAVLKPHHPHADPKRTAW